MLDSLFDHANFGLGLLDSELRFVRMNPVLAELLPAISPKVLEGGRGVVAGGKSATGIRIEGPGEEEGTVRTFDCAYHPVCSGEDVDGVWLTVTEVTDERRAGELMETATADLARERGILREVIGRAPAPMAVMWGEELVFAYVNDQAQAMVGEGEMLGRRAADVFPVGADLADELRDTVLLKGETAQVKDVPVGDRFWTFACVAIPSPEGRPGGVLAVGQDTTEAVTQSRQLEEELADEQRIATQLQVSLMPDRLPAIPGMDLASGFRPAGDGHEIGGDFYDVFEVADGCWMVVIGDVCGKGAEAAALTALARYTLRAAAIREGAEPATLLRQLNEAIMRQSDDMRFLSAVCLFLDLGHDGSTRARVCVAGHLPPLVVRPGGAVEAIEGGAGPVLGVWEDPQLAEQEVRLEEGARMVLYTDGVLDARSGSELTEEGLAAIVSGLSDADAAATVAAIERSVIDPGESGRDDMAVLVIRPAA